MFAVIADSGWSHFAQWMVVVVAVGLIVALGFASQAVRRGNRNGWIGVAAVVVILALGFTASFPVSKSRIDTPPTQVSHR